MAIEAHPAAADLAAPADASIPTEPEAAPPGPTLHVRVEPTGLSAERAVAVVCAGTPLARDASAPLGRPAAEGVCSGGAAVLDHLVTSAALALDEIDLHLTVRRP